MSNAPITDNALHLPHDVINPAAVSWWPLAYGWWIVIMLTLIALCSAAYFLWQRYKKRAPLRRALRELVRAQTLTDTRQFVASLSAILRRVAMSVHGRERAASLTGEAWLQFLDRTAAPKRSLQSAFTQAHGRCLIAIYAPQTLANDSIDRHALTQLCQDWLMQQFTRPVIIDKAQAKHV